jgi:hypothetical protein
LRGWVAKEGVHECDAGESKACGYEDETDDVSFPRRAWITREDAGWGWWRLETFDGAAPNEPAIGMSDYYDVVALIYFARYGFLGCVNIVPEACVWVAGGRGKSD